MKKFIGIFLKFTGWLERFVEVLIIAMFSIMVLSILATVLTRNISISIVWLEELARYMQIWFVSLGFAIALRKGLLTNTDVFLKSLSKSKKNIVVYGNKILIILISLFIIGSGIPFIKNVSRGNQLSSTLRVPMAWIYGALIAGFALSLLFALSSIVANIIGERDGVDEIFDSTEANAQTK